MPEETAGKSKSVDRLCIVIREMFFKIKTVHFCWRNANKDSTPSNRKNRSHNLHKILII